jgi:hypothetical protein
VAVGSFDNSANHPRALATSLASGSWRRAARVRLPATAATRAPARGSSLNAAACIAGHGCVTAGSFALRSGGWAGLVLTRSAV